MPAYSRRAPRGHTGLSPSGLLLPIAMPHFFDLHPDSLAAYCASNGMPTYLAAQLFDWVYAKGVVDPNAMSNISAQNRAILVESMKFYAGQIVRHQVATDGTQKLLIDW